MPDNHAQLNHLSTLLDASSTFPFVSVNIRALPVSSGPADGLCREIESIRLSSSFHHQTSVPTASEYSPAVMLQLHREPYKDTALAMFPLQYQSFSSQKQNIRSCHKVKTTRTKKNNPPHLKPQVPKSISFSLTARPP